MRPLEIKQRLGLINQSSFDCIVLIRLATPKTVQEQTAMALHGRDASCTIAAHLKSVSEKEAGPHSGPATPAGRAAAP